MECEVSVGCDWKICQNLNTWDVFWINQVQMRQSVVGRWRVGGRLQVSSGPHLMLGIYSLTVLETCMKHFY